MTIWIHGPSAWDSVVEIGSFPKPGDFLRAVKKSERPGGSGLNVALAIASADTEAGFITYLGNDEYGLRLEEVISQSGLKVVHVKRSTKPTLHALILKDESGERTIIALETTEMAELGLGEAKIESGDIFVFTIWFPEYKQILDKLRNIGVTSIVGTKALEDSDVFADHVVGSQKDFKALNLDEIIKRFGKVVITEGSNGVTLINGSSKIHQASLADVVRDSTGAGDSFLAGYALAVSKHMKDEECLYLASVWAAASLATDSSIPPKWESIKDRLGSN